MHDARSDLHKYAVLTAAVLLPVLAAYVFALARGLYALSAISSLMMLVWLLFAGDLLLKPRMRYARFLKEMKAGLRRQLDCIPEELSGDIQVQDGVRVRSLQVRLTDGGESRILYVNAAKADLLPPMNRPVRLVSYGRHVIEFMEI